MYATETASTTELAQLRRLTRALEDATRGYSIAPPVLFYTEGVPHVAFPGLYEDMEFFDALDLMEFERAFETCPRLAPRPYTNICLEPQAYKNLRLEITGAAFRLLRRDPKCLRKLRKHVIDDFDRLWALYIPFTPDLTKLEAVLDGWGTMHAGIGGLHFDLGIDIDDRTTPWKELKQARKRVLESHFDVLEFLASLSKLTPPPPKRLTIDPDPSIASKALRMIFGSSTEYSAGLCQFLVDFGEAHILSHPMGYWSRLQFDCDKMAFLTLYVDALVHTIGLADKCIQAGYTTYGNAQLSCARVGRAVLSTIFTAMLIAHRIKIPVDFSGVLRKTKHLTPDWYLTHDDYKAARKCRRDTRRMIRGLDDIERARFQLIIGRLVDGKSRVDGQAEVDGEAKA